MFTLKFITKDKRNYIINSLLQDVPCDMQREIIKLCKNELLSIHTDNPPTTEQDEDYLIDDYTDVAFQLMQDVMNDSESLNYFISKFTDEQNLNFVDKILKTSSEWLIKNGKKEQFHNVVGIGRTEKLLNNRFDTINGHDNDIVENLNNICNNYFTDSDLVCQLARYMDDKDMKGFTEHLADVKRNDILNVAEEIKNSEDRKRLIDYIKLHSEEEFSKNDLWLLSKENIEELKNRVDTIREYLINNI